MLITDCPHKGNLKRLQKMKKRSTAQAAADVLLRLRGYTWSRERLKARLHWFEFQNMLTDTLTFNLQHGAVNSSETVTPLRYPTSHMDATVFAAESPYTPVCA